VRPVAGWLSGGHGARAALAGALLLGATLRGLGLDRQSLWTDELYVVWEARQPFATLFDPALHIQHPPGYRLALHAWLGLGVSEAWIRLLPALAGLLLIAVLWGLARGWWPERPAAAALVAGLAATSPWLLHYSQDATVYSWAALWVSAGVLALARAWQTDRPAWWIAWSGSLAIALYSHYFAVFPLAAEAIWIGLMSRRGGAAVRWHHAIAAGAVAGVLYLPWLAALLTQGHDSLQTSLFPLTVDTQLARWLPALLAGYAHPPFWQAAAGDVLAWGGLGLAAAWGIRRIGRAGRARYGPPLTLLALWGGAALVGPYLFLRVTTPPDALDSVRFAALAAPALLLAVAAGLAAAPAGGRTVGVLAWCAIVAWQWPAEVTAPPTQDWRGLLGIIAREAQAGDAWLAFPAFHAGAASAYYPVPLAVPGGWFTRAGADPTGAAYWFPPGWRWRAWYALGATPTTDWAGALAARTGAAGRLWYLAGDGADGTYPPSPAAERALAAAGWQPAQTWTASPLVLRLYTRARATGWTASEKPGCDPPPGARPPDCMRPPGPAP
jgi:mannosyltransferase